MGRRTEGGNRGERGRTVSQTGQWLWQGECAPRRTRDGDHLDALNNLTGGRFLATPLFSLRENAIAKEPPGRFLVTEACNAMRSITFSEGYRISIPLDAERGDPR
jgi:hypothetical protein